MIIFLIAFSEQNHNDPRRLGVHPKRLTGALNLPLDVLRNLPFPCFYIETPQILGDRYHGFFVAYDQVKDGTPLLRCMAVKKENTLNFNFSEIRLEKGINLSNGITGAVTKAATEAGITFLKGDPNIEIIIYIMISRNSD